MNWLAHLHLSPPTARDRVGALLPDLLNNRELAEVHPDFAAGIREHRLIDAYTDRHPVFLRSAGRIGGELRRFRSIVVDIFYDHFLSIRWPHYCPQPLEEFVRNFHTSTALLEPLLPEAAVIRFQQMEAGGWLTSYSTVEGIRVTLERVSLRLSRPVDLSAGASKLAEHYGPLAEDFEEFYPLLQEHVAQNRR